MQETQDHAGMKTRDRRAYQASRRSQAVTLYFRSTAEMETYKAAALEGGYASNFNGWILQMLSNAASGSLFPPEYVEGLKQELGKARSWLETSRDENQDYRSQVKLLQAQRDTLLTLLHGLPEGGEIAARFLEQAANQSGVRA